MVQSDDPCANEIIRHSLTEFTGRTVFSTGTLWTGASLNLQMAYCSAV
jgi:hypothetical protein